MVCFSSPLAISLARLLASRKPLVYDAFTSIYEGDVVDRKLYRKNSIWAYRSWLIDWLSCSLADIVLTDTQAHVDYFVYEFRLNRKKFRRIFVGSDIFSL